MTEPSDSRENAAFRDALIATAESVMPERYDTGGLVEWDIADAILAMPEMQAIRRFIKAYSEGTADDDSAALYAFDALPPSVDQWAEEAQ